MTCTIHSCGTHRVYHLSCDEYDALRARAAGRCEACCVSGPELVVDHDHALGMAAVRGMVCPLCNSRLARVDAGTEAPDAYIVAYLLNAWHQCRPIEFHPDNRTPGRNLRLRVDLWDEAKRIANDRRETLSAVMKRALVEYVEKHGGTVER